MKKEIAERILATLDSPEMDPVERLEALLSMERLAKLLLTQLLMDLVPYRRDEWDI